jgi:inhibitor of KinA sporulation pathway (predicted exonuclease)
MQQLKTVCSAIYLDLEWDCGGRARPAGAVPDIIELGLVQMDPVLVSLMREANFLVRPKCVDVSLICSSITGITRTDLLHAPTLPEVISAIGRHWPAKATCFSRGTDGEILTQACRERHLAVPFRRFVDLSLEFQHLFLLRDLVSVRNALNFLKTPFDGGEHMAVVDARNIARIHAEMMRRLRSFAPPPQYGQERPATGDPTWFGGKLLTSLSAFAPTCEAKLDLQPGKEDDHHADKRP